MYGKQSSYINRLIICHSLVAKFAAWQCFSSPRGKSVRVSTATPSGFGREPLSFSFSAVIINYGNNNILYNI